MALTRAIAILCLLFAVCVSAESAVALEKKDVLGKWCTGKIGVAEFVLELTNDHMKIRKLPAGEVLQLQIMGFDVTADTIIVRWFGQDGIPRKSGFTNFSADGRRMAQMQPDERPEMPHWRC